MTDSEWRYHRERAIPIKVHMDGDEALCSRMRDGRIKIECEVPMTENQILNWLPRELPNWHGVLEKLRSLV